MRVLVLLLTATAVGGAQQVDTVLPSPTRRVVDVSSFSGTFLIKTWERPAIRVEARGSGAAGVRVDMTASLVVVRQSLGTARAIGIPRVDTVFDAQGRVGELHTLISAPQRVCTTVPLAPAPTSGVNSTRTDSARVARDTTGDLPTRVASRYSCTMPPSVPSSVSYTITVPRYAGVVVRGGSGDIIVDGAIDSLELSNVNGSIRATNVSGKVSLSSLEGRVEVDGMRGDLLARTLSGVVVVRNAEGSVEAQGVAGSIDLFDVRAKTVIASTYDGGISIDGALPANGTITLSTLRGPLGMPRSGPCANVFAGARNVQVSPKSGELYRLVLTTTTPANGSGPTTCTLRRD